MNFFKKLFGSSESKDKSTQTQQVDLLEAYKNVPWMTSLRLENISICLNLGFRPSISLPTDFERQLRPKEEIARRLNAINALVLWLMVPEQDLSNERILKFVKVNNLDQFLTEEEKQIIYKKRGDKQKGIPKIGNQKPKPKGFSEAQKERFKDRYRKIYIQYSRLNSVCITCFLNQNKGYKIFTLMKMNIKDINSDYFYSFIIKNE
jgi:hypothetical protein